MKQLLFEVVVLAPALRPRHVFELAEVATPNAPTPTATLKFPVILPASRALSPTATLYSPVVQPFMALEPIAVL